MRGDWLADDAAGGTGAKSWLEDADEKMDEDIIVEKRPAPVVRKPGEPTPEQR